jgi:hypothetical protein
MKKRAALKVWFSFLLICHGIMAQSFNDKDVRQQIVFTENKGQVHDQNYQPQPDVLYGVMTGNMSAHIKRTGVSYQLYRVDRFKEFKDIKTKATIDVIDQQTIYRVDLNWLNANTNFNYTQDEVLPGYNNYYSESCLDGALYVKSYKGISLKNLYNGVDLHYYVKDGELKHDYLVAAHADYKQIRIRVEGAEIRLDNDGSLLLVTPLGSIQEVAPTVYQNGKQLNAKWSITNKILSFEIENCDPNYSLIIDPITRLWGSYYGGNGDDRSRSCTTDAFGNVYFVGPTASNTGTIIATSGSHQVTLAGSSDAYLAKFQSTGNRLWATYYGGSTGELGTDCSVDQSGNVYLTGYTSSNSGISSLGAHQAVFGGGTDAFLAKFDANGIKQWGTYYGSSGLDYAYSCNVDLSGNIFVSGETASSTGTFISSPGSHQTNYGGGNSDAFLVKFNSSGIRQWATYYGGAIGYEFGYCCVSDANGNIYLIGATGSNTGITIATLGSHQPTYGGGTFDAFIAKFNSNGIRLWGTYFGGVGVDVALAATIDGSGNIFVVGSTDTNTGTVIATVASHQFISGGLEDAFLAKFDSNGVRQWSTYYGGNAIDLGMGVSTDNIGNVYLVGQTATNSGTIIAEATSHQAIFGGGTFDAFLVKFTTNGIRQSSTYYGGPGEDIGYSCIVHNSGVVYLSGWTNTNAGSSIASSSIHQSTYGGGNYDGFLAKFDVCDLAPSQPAAIYGNSNICSGSSSNTYSIASVAGATSYTWSLPAGWSGSSNTNSISATPGSSGIFSVAAGNACGASAQQTLSVTVNPLPTITASSSSSILCEGESATLTASGASTYTFNPGGTGTSIVVTPPVTSVYTISGTDANGCSNTFIFTQNVDACVGINSNNMVTSGGVEMYPNPTEGKLNLELISNCEVTIINSLGQLVYETNLSSGKHELELENLAKGLYVVKVKSGKDLVTIKVIRD